ncbi:MAG: hypothetical protein AAGC83_09180, partial [Pseudomonadota bacterium]
MTSVDLLKRFPPKKLSRARALAHQAVQFVTKAARANLAGEEDDSHSNLGWSTELRAFVSHPLAKTSVAVSLSPLQLLILDADAVTVRFDLTGRSVVEAGGWLDGELSGRNLKTTSGIDIPYDLPEEAAAIHVFEDVDELAALAAWFDLAHVCLSQFASSITDLRPGPSPVRCWPHHFDIATYVALETGDPESAKGIGVGLSPGDEAYDQPYIYVNPWPHLDSDHLPEAPKPGHWHSQGFVGAIATADELLTTNEISTAFSSFIRQAFE